MIPNEANYAEWFTCAARFHFLREGYAFLSFELAQVEEEGFPLVALQATGSRVVGLRFLPRAVADGGGLAYTVEESTRARMAGADGWLVYALPQSADPLDQQLTHQKVLFAGDADTTCDSSGHLTVERAVTFKELVAALEEGALGREVAPEETAAAFAAAARAGEATLYLVLNQGRRTAIVLGNQWR